jgi:hypothetical protein
MATLWVRGICDGLLQVVADWLRRWPNGKEAADRLFMHKNGAQEMVVTRRAVVVRWHPKELRELIRILKAMRPEWEFVLDLERFYTGAFQRSKLLSGGRREAEMVSYLADVEDIFKALLRARAGQTNLGKEVESGSFWDSV